MISLDLLVGGWGTNEYESGTILAPKCGEEGWGSNKLQTVTNGKWHFPISFAVECY